MPQILSRLQLNRATLARQLLLERTELPVDEAVGRLGALQSQHPEWPPIALASRLDGSQPYQLERAFAERRVVRAGTLRMTQHTVVAADFWPMWTVTQPFRLDQWRLLCRRDPTDASLLRRLAPAYDAARSALVERPLRRDVFTEILKRLAPSDLVDLPQRGLSRHFMAIHPLVQVPHQGETYGRGRYTTAEHWLGPAPEIAPADARVTLLRRHLAAFGPASLDDALMWIGRGRGGIRPWRDALAQLSDETVSFHDEAGGTLHDLAGAPRPSTEIEAPPRLLARWDSVLLAHATGHRGRIIGPQHVAAVYTRNADVLPTLLLDGFVAGTWDLQRADGAQRITLRPFTRLRGRALAALQDEAQRLLATVGSASDRRVVDVARAQDA